MSLSIAAATTPGDYRRVHRRHYEVEGSCEEWGRPRDVSETGLGDMFGCLCQQPFQMFKP